MNKHNIKHTRIHTEAENGIRFFQVFDVANFDVLTPARLLNIVSQYTPLPPRDQVHQVIKKIESEFDLGR